MTITIIPFDTWTDPNRPKYNNTPDPAPKITGLTAHWQGSKIKHTLTVDEEIRILQAILADHLSRINPKTNRKVYATIAYNFAIFQSGRIYELRGRNRKSGAQGKGNDSDLAILFVISTDDELSNAARESFITLRDHLSNQNVGHKLHTHSPDWSNTQCPGDSVRHFIEQLETNENPKHPQPPKTSPTPQKTGLQPFPLPNGHWFGKPNPSPKNHSGFPSKNFKSWKEDQKEIKKIQKILGIKTDGLFGVITEAHVRAFQQQQALRIDGLVGQKTWPKLMKQGAKK